MPQRVLDQDRVLRAAERMFHHTASVDMDDLAARLAVSRATL